MGNYTELIFGAALKENTPQDIIDSLVFYTGGEDAIPPELQHHEPIVFRGSSYYFGVSECVNRMWFDDISNQWHISTRSNIKNYEGEIEKFLSWIKPHIESGSGYSDIYGIVIAEDAETATLYKLDYDGNNSK